MFDTSSGNGILNRCSLYICIKLDSKSTDSWSQQRQSVSDLSLYSLLTRGLRVGLIWVWVLLCDEDRRSDRFSFSLPEVIETVEVDEHSSFSIFDLCILLP